MYADDTVLQAKSVEGFKKKFQTGTQSLDSKVFFHINLVKTKLLIGRRQNSALLQEMTQYAEKK